MYDFLSDRIGMFEAPVADPSDTVVFDRQYEHYNGRHEASDELFRAIFEDAIKTLALDVRKYARKHGRFPMNLLEMDTEVVQWLFADDDLSPCSFYNICGFLNFDPESVIKGLEKRCSDGTLKIAHAHTHALMTKVAAPRKYRKKRGKGGKRKVGKEARYVEKKPGQ